MYSFIGQESGTSSNKWLPSGLEVSAKYLINILISLLYRFYAYGDDCNQPSSSFWWIVMENCVKDHNFRRFKGIFIQFSLNADEGRGAARSPSNWRCDWYLTAYNSSPFWSRWAANGQHQNIRGFIQLLFSLSS